MSTFYSASAIVGGTVTGHYVYQVDGYSRTKELTNGKRILSPTFWVGDYSWRISYYPNGVRSSYADYISVFLVLGDRITKPVKVQRKFSLLDKAGKPVPDHSQRTELREYFTAGAGHGFSDFIKREFLEASEHLVDDCFKIRCDISVPACIRAEDRAPPLSDLQRHLGDLLVAKEGADVTFQVGGETFSAHRCVLAARSPNSRLTCICDFPRIFVKPLAAMPTLDFASANVGGPVDRRDLGVDHYWHMKQLHRNGQRITSRSLKAGGFSLRIHYYPNCVSSSCKDYISIFMALDSRVSHPIKASARFSLLDQSGEPVPGHFVCTGVREYSGVGAMHVYDLFIWKKSLEASEHLVDGCFTIGWDVCVDRATPLSDLPDPDVVFQVGGEMFSAHRRVLAERSPALEAELFRATREGAAAGDCIRIDDMLPEVFESLLQFVYTDSLPEMDDEQEESMMAEDLLLAADRFDMPGLKLICEEKLCSDIDEDTVADMLRFAAQHHCRLLRDACIEFLGDPPVLQAAMATDHDLLELVAKSCPGLLKELWDSDEDDPMQAELAICF
ncbi:BTB/POZ and MATH domain-containing protein 1 [Dichanthelium oligosanthes]|uniref:BTB/POZ and MATH domain-containing protein 1 n=1 Tax=Dichanthelium oligosanthes TaxID=888268 RepID=A0A1E5UIW4_9POAL|nr:BTB/POZ and MATH domain-containing protein 1 [Dichanthelium oligosanthes]